jgi:hypothetical protein
MPLNDLAGASAGQCHFVDMNRNAGHQVGSTKTTGGWGAEKQPRSPPNRIHEATLAKITVHGGRARAELGRNREIARARFHRRLLNQAAPIRPPRRRGSPRLPSAGFGRIMTLK